MFTHTTRSFRSRRMATALLLPAVGLGLLTACSGGASAESSESSASREAAEELEAKDSLEQTCEGWLDILFTLGDVSDELQAELEEVDEDNLEEILPLYRDYGENFQQLAAELSELAENARIEKMADAIGAAGYAFDEVGKSALSVAEVDLDSPGGDIEVQIAAIDYSLYEEELLLDEELLEGADYVAKTCRF